MSIVGRSPSVLQCSVGLVTVRARPSVFRGELVIENSGKEPVSEGLVIVNVGARPSMLKGELVSENNKEEPVSL